MCAMPALLPSNGANISPDALAIINVVKLAVKGIEGLTKGRIEKIQSRLIETREQELNL